MARKIVVVCDRCEEPAALKRYRVGTLDQIHFLDLCEDCSSPLVDLIGIGASRQAEAVRLRPSTPQELRRLKAAARRK